MSGIDGIEILDELFRSYVLPNAPLETLGEGYRWLEGPVWIADMQCLLVSDIPNDRVLRWTENGGVSVFRQPSGYANGHTRDRQGRLLSCSHHNRCVSRTEYDGSETVLVGHYQGKRLNSPNDIVVKSDGSVWFSDPDFGIHVDYEGGKQESELPTAYYRFDPASGDLYRLTDDVVEPNGLCFSPDEKTLYLIDSGAQFSTQPVHHIYAYDVLAEAPYLTNRRVFHTVDRGFADGMRCDEHGNVWSSAGDGVHCISPAGKLLGKILVPFTVSNLEFGGRHYSRLFICGSHTLYAIYTNVRGARRP